MAGEKVGALAIKMREMCDDADVTLTGLVKHALGVISGVERLVMIMGVIQEHGAYLGSISGGV